MDLRKVSFPQCNFFSIVFYLQFVESVDVEPTDIEGQLNARSDIC